MDSTTGLWLLGAVLVYQGIVTIRVAAAVEYSRFQKLTQILLIWTIPLFGAVACHIFLSADQQVPKTPDGPFTPDGGGNPPGIGQDGGYH
jgi:hypothetical protein